jgi:hypothetical protein
MGMDWVLRQNVAVPLEWVCLYCHCNWSITFVQVFGITVIICCKCTLSRQLIDIKFMLFSLDRQVKQKLYRMKLHYIISISCIVLIVICRSFTVDFLSLLTSEILPSWSLCMWLCRQWGIETNELLSVFWFKTRYLISHTARFPVS